MYKHTDKYMTAKNNGLTEFFGCLTADEAKSIENEIKKQRKIDYLSYFKSFSSSVKKNYVVFTLLVHFRP